MSAQTPPEHRAPSIDQTIYCRICEQDLAACQCDDRRIFLQKAQAYGPPSEEEWEMWKLKGMLS